MSDKELTTEKLKEFEQIILKERQASEELIRELDELQKHSLKDSSGDLSSYSLHQADLGTDTIYAEKRVYYLNGEIEKLRKLNLALKRIYDKSYGVCEICGKQIGEKRLHAIPYARYCIECKSADEKKKKKH
ncbi:MAG: TraR/DksA family transcriptional regulator [Candidatus Cloacimonetes bacterium]|nr:TraR/DksA family transcriptional regulator [Candidatus Cloacimonadota bacterium]